MTLFHPRPAGALGRRLVNALVLLGALSSLGRAEKVDSRPEELRAIATHIVEGRVESIFAKRELRGGMERLAHQALISIDGVLKGDGLSPGDRVGVRYWTQHWILPSTPPTDTNGHAPIPRTGDRVRVHVVDRGYNGFGETIDGGYDVVGRNGFEILARKSGVSPEATTYDDLTADWRRTALLVGAGGLLFLGFVLARFVRKRNGTDAAQDLPRARDDDLPRDGMGDGRGGG